ncbi:MAG: hypothetical protein ACKVQU_20375 [Burkholderiales bacterium]
MKRARSRKCLCCGELFPPDARTLRHQRHGAKPACRKASKAASQCRWLAVVDHTNIPKPRADRGGTRALPQSVAEVLLGLKEANRALSIPQAIRACRQNGLTPVGLVIAPSTVHRLFSSAGLMAPLPDQPNPHDRRKFAFAHAGQLWMSDVMHGPSVALPQRGRRKTYLVAFLGDATRLVPYCAPLPSRRIPKRSCRSSSRHCFVAAFHNACTSTMAPITARNTWRWCAPS